nr:hypothetical protein [Candidatus Sigynarchaeota archaeon]
MGSGKVLLYIIGAGALFGITYGFFYAVNWLNGFLGGFNVVTYASTVWTMTAVLAGLVVFSALAEGHVRMEMLSSASFLIFIIIAYTAGCTILSFFMPYSGFGALNVGFMANLSSIVPILGAVSANIVFANTLTATFIVIAQALKFVKTFLKSMKKSKDDRK